MTSFFVPRHALGACNAAWRVPLLLVRRRQTGPTLPQPHRYIWPAELDLMAQLAGFKLETRHADWRDTEFTGESPSHVTVYRKTTDR